MDDQERIMSEEAENTRNVDCLVDDYREYLSELSYAEVEKIVSQGVLILDRQLLGRK